MSRLGNILKKGMPIDRVLAECGECEVELYDSKKSSEKSPKVTGDIISMQARAHRSETGHDDLQVAIDKKAPVKEIDATITVNS